MIIIKEFAKQFLNILSIGKSCVSNWKQSNIQNINTENQQSMPQINQVTKFIRTNPFQRELISLNEFLENLPKMETHY